MVRYVVLLSWQYGVLDFLYVKQMRNILGSGYFFVLLGNSMIL